MNLIERWENIQRSINWLKSWWTWQSSLKQIWSSQIYSCCWLESSFYFVLFVNDCKSEDVDNKEIEPFENSNLEMEEQDYIRLKQFTTVFILFWRIKCEDCGKLNFSIYNSNCLDLEQRKTENTTLGYNNKKGAESFSLFLKHDHTGCSLIADTGFSVHKMIIFWGCLHFFQKAISPWNKGSWLFLIH